MNVAVDNLKGIKQYCDVLSAISSGAHSIGMYGLLNESKAYMLYGLLTHSERKLLYIVADEMKARTVHEELLGFHVDSLLFTHREIMLYDIQASSMHSTSARLDVLSKLMRREGKIVVASIDAIMDICISPRILEENSIHLDLATSVSLTELSEKLVRAGYERVQQVEGTGQFSVRGGILDVFSPSGKSPVRIEFFGDEVDSIRSFDPLSQRSIEMMTEVWLIPAREILLLDEYRTQLIKDLTADLKKSVKKNPDRAERLNEKFLPLIECIEQKAHLANRDLVIPFIKKYFASSIFDFLDEEFLIVNDEPERINERANFIRDDIFTRYEDLLDRGELLTAHSDMLQDEERITLGRLNRQNIIMQALLRSTEAQLDSINSFSMRAGAGYMGNLEVLKEELSFNIYNGYKVIIFAGNDERCERICSLIESIGLTANYIKTLDAELKTGQIAVLAYELGSGFTFSHNKLMILTDAQILKVGKRKKKNKSDDRKPISYTDLKIGDYVVHEAHGIGQYVGTETLVVQGVMRDYLRIEYRGEDRLFIPTDQLSMIYKYIGKDGAPPKKNKLNSSEWKNQKAKARSVVAEMAQDLIELYAKRQNVKGYAFGEDTQWQFQFEDTFMYEETEGQLRSANEIKSDMEKPHVMDRLLCADVGYGKTEVALRAAFKAIMEGKQVAVLVPTMLLAMQHYATMLERFKDFPVKVGILSRFVKPAEIKNTVEGVRKGFIDVVVGTHRLLSEDIEFKDLGLLIIDEEQRFGVRHKETLKFYKENVDTLTLSATPIPRTLQMSLSGVRDMSVIETPPEERLPVQTYVAEYQDALVREAIMRELARGGQVYFLFNRVEFIDSMAERLRNLVPEAQIEVAHGQMTEAKLESVMRTFYEKEADVLVCSTIIETGIDLPNVNTIIITDSDKFGLSQLYQLRGRVGRSSRMAYCYLTYQKDKVLTEISEKRLMAIKEFTEFGSGFKIAMRDLELRGAGNLLGTAQHGQIASIGYDLYIKYLSEAVNALKGEKTEAKNEATVDIRVDAYIPATYIENEEERLDIYKKIATIETQEDYEGLYDEILDRFGEPEEAVVNLMDISLIRCVASLNCVRNISDTQQDIKLDFIDGYKLKMSAVNELTELFKRRVSFGFKGRDSITLRRGESPLADLKSAVMQLNRVRLQFD